MALAGAYALTTLRSRVIFDGESEFGRVRVVERWDGLRTLYMGAGRARQSAIHPGCPLHLEFAYLRVAMVGPALAPPAARILFVGLGGGAMPMYTRQVRPDAHLEAVEIDPLIVELAERYFGFLPDERLVAHVGDGRAFIEAAPQGSYDAIVLDAFSDDEVPFALTTREFLASVRAALAPGGVVVSNLWTASPAYPAMVATYQATFEQVRLLRVPRRAQRILVAGRDDRRLERGALVEAARWLAQRADLGFDLPGLVEDGYESPSPFAAPVLRDARAPGAANRDPGSFSTAPPPRPRPEGQSGSPRGARRPSHPRSRPGLPTLPVSFPFRLLERNEPRLRLPATASARTSRGEQTITVVVPREPADTDVTALRTLQPGERERRKE